MNTDFYKDLDTNFEQAVILCEKEFSHDELLELLKNGNIPQKQIAALKFDYVKTKEDADALISVLTGCDGKIREAAALKIYQLTTDDEIAREIFSHTSPKIFADATIDINANICRLIVDSVKQLKIYNEFTIEYVQYITNYTVQALDELDKFVFRDKKYVINKQLFKLYWCLETLKSFYEKVEMNTMLDILNRSANQTEYTVREKAAQIAVLSNDFREIQLMLKNDSNYYVNKIFLKSS